MKLRNLLLSPLLLVGLLSSAQAPVKQTDKFGNEYLSYTNDDTKSRWYIMDNGLTVILAPNHEKPRIQTLIATKAGSSSDPSDHTGLAHYLEHMLFKGTDRYGSLDFAKEKPLLDEIDALYERYNHTTDEAERKHIYHLIDSVSGEAAKYAIANEYDRMLQAIGASGTNAFTSFERTVYVNDIPSNQVATWLDIEAERFRNPILRLFHTELEAVYEEKNRSLDNDNWKVYEQMLAAAFPNHNYGRQTTIGTIEHLKNPSLTSIRNYYHAYYVPNNMAIIMAGDLDAAETYKNIKERFSYMEPKKVPHHQFKDETSLLSPQIIEVVGPSAENLTICYRMPDALSDEAELLTLVDLKLNNSKAGLIDINMVKAQKCLGAYSNPMMLKERGMHTFSGRPLEGQSLEDLEQLFYEQIDKLKNGEFDMSIVKSIVLNQEVDEIKRNQSYAGVAYTLMDNFVMGKDWGYDMKATDRMLQYTKDDIMEFAKKYYVPGNIVIYKRKGEKPETIKIEKPEITKVEVNRGKTSPFVEDILNREPQQIQPQYIDFENDIEFAKYGKMTPIWKVKDGDEKLFSLYYVLDIGSRHDQKLAMAVEYLKYLGTNEYSADEIAKKFYDLACNFGVSTGTEQSYVYLNGLAESFDEALELFEHLLENAQPDQQKLDQMIASKLKAREDAKLNKGAIMSRLRSFVLYGPQNPSNTILTEDEMRSIKASELSDYIHDLTSYEHKIWYSGPLTIKQLCKSLKKRHNKVKNPIPAPEKREFEMADHYGSHIYFADYDMVQAEITWLKKSTELDTKEAAIINAFNEYFGGGMSSIVFQEIREAKALAYSTYSFYSSARRLGDHNVVMAYVGTQADKLSEGIDAMNELLVTLPVDQGKFDNAKVALRQSFATQRSVRTSVLFAYDQALRLGYDQDPNIERSKKLEKLTMADVVEFHRTRINGEYQYALVGSKDKIDFESLKEYGDIVEVSLEELFGY